MSSYFDDEVYSFSEVDAPVEYGASQLPLETLNTLKADVDSAVDFLITRGKGLIDGAQYVILVNSYKRISNIYDNMIAVTKYNMMLPAEQERKKLLATGQQIMIFDKPTRPPLPTTKQEWENQFDPIVLEDDPFNYNFVPISKIIPPPGWERTRTTTSSQ